MFVQSWCIGRDGNQTSNFQWTFKITDTKALGFLCYEMEDSCHQKSSSCQSVDRTAAPTQTVRWEECSSGSCTFYRAYIKAQIGVITFAITTCMYCVETPPAPLYCLPGNRGWTDYIDEYWLWCTPRSVLGQHTGWNWTCFGLGHKVT